MSDEMKTTNSGSSLLKGRTSLWVGLGAAGLIGLQFYFYWLERRTLQLAFWFEARPGMRLVLGVMAFGLSMIVAIGMRRQAQPRLAGLVAVLVGALVNAPASSLHGALFGALGAWSARQSAGKTPDEGTFLQAIGRALPRYRPTALELLGAASAACLSWLIFDGQLREWQYYVGSTGIATNWTFLTAFNVDEWIAILVVLAVAILAIHVGRAILATSAIGTGLGLLASWTVFHVDPAWQLPVAGVLAAMILAGQIIFVIRNTYRSFRSTTSRANQAYQLLLWAFLGLVGWSAIWVGIQLDTIRRIGFLANANCHSNVLPSQSPGEYLLGIGYVDGVACYESATAPKLNMIRGFPFLRYLHLEAAYASLSGLSHQLEMCFIEQSPTLSQCMELGQYPRLQSVGLRGLTDEKLAALLRAPLQTMIAENGSLSPAAMKSLRSKTLVRLHLSHLSLTDEHLAQLPALPALVELRLGRNQLRGETLDRLKIHPSLAYLTLDLNPIDESTLPKLQGFPALSNLSLDGVKLHNASVSQLGSLPVTHLSLQQTAVNEAWVAEFRRQVVARPANGPTLVSVSLGGDSSLPEPCLKSLKEVIQEVE